MPVTPVYRLIDFLFKIKSHHFVTFYCTFSEKAIQNRAYFNLVTKPFPVNDFWKKWKFWKHNIFSINIWIFLSRICKSNAIATLKINMHKSFVISEIIYCIFSRVYQMDCKLMPSRYCWKYMVEKNNIF